MFGMLPHIRVHTGGTMKTLPQPTILHQNSKLIDGTHGGTAEENL